MEREILEIFTEWNPLGVPEYCLDDEYGYLVDGILENCDSQEQIFIYLIKILTENMGLDIDKSHENEIDEIAKKMYNVIYN